MNDSPLIRLVLLVLTASGCQNKEEDQAEVGPHTRARDPVAKETSLQEKGSEFVLPAGVVETPASLHVTITEELAHLEAREKYGDPIDRMLVGEKLGNLRQSMPIDLPNGNRGVALDLEVNNLRAALPQVVRTLRNLNVPEGSRVERLSEGPIEPISVSVW